jgi:hypothetical protein
MSTRSRCWNSAEPHTRPNPSSLSGNRTFAPSRNFDSRTRRFSPRLRRGFNRGDPGRFVDPGPRRRPRGGPDAASTDMRRTSCRRSSPARPDPPGQHPHQRAIPGDRVTRNAATRAGDRWKRAERSVRLISTSASVTPRFWLRSGAASPVRGSHEVENRMESMMSSIS